jgi:hypothetical protein
MASSGSRKVVRALMNEEEEFMEIDTPQGSSLKRATGKAMNTSERSNTKKSKSGEIVCTTAPEKLDRKYWLGFNYMELLAIESDILECYSGGPVEDLITQGYLRIEAEELEQAIVSYSRIPQKLYPSSRNNKVLGQHYNLTQLPFDVETNPDT